MTIISPPELFQNLNVFLQNQRADNKKPVIAVVGPTASGKTALSLRLAQQYNGEIISADSRQVYKYMDIGTDKLPVAKRQGIPHHLLDIVEPSQEFTVADFKRLALQAIEDIHQRGKLPILCGGTGLYLNVLLQNYQVPRIAPQTELRQKLEQYAQEHGTQALHQLLQQHDPASAATIHPNNVRYVIRALEICLTTNQKKENQKGETLFPYFTIGIYWPREILYERINQRVDELVERGLLNEVKTLLMQGYTEDSPAMSSLGYPEFIAYLKGSITLEAAVELLKKNTRNFCKRQLTWFRRDNTIHWVDGKELEEYLRLQ